MTLFSLRAGNSSRFTLCMLLLALTLPGCSGRQTGPERHPLKGSITFDGKPIRHGRIMFTPDVDKGNRGPGSIAFIKDGAYETYEGKGIVGTAYTVDITGYCQEIDLSADNLPPPEVDKIFSVDLPEEGGTYDFELKSS